MGPHAVSGRDAARDDLTPLVHEFNGHPDLLIEALLARGYRRSVTPSEFDNAAEAIGDFVGGLPFARSAVLVVARAFGLEVTE